MIAVNGAIEWLDRADHWFTLDPSAANLRRMEEPRRGVQYHAAVPNDRKLPGHVTRWHRIGHRSTQEPANKHSPVWWMWRWSAVPGISTQDGQINSGNSAWGALQLACKMGARRVVLVGVDASREPRVEGGAPNNLSHLPLLFESALGTPGFEFVNCGAMQSRVPQMSIEGGMRWLSQ